MKTKFNNYRLLKKITILPLLFCAVFLFSCDSFAQKSKEHGQSRVEGKGHDKDGKNHGEERKGHDEDESPTMRGEHSRDKGGDGEGEEDGTQLGLEGTYNVTKHGVNLVLNYNKSTNSFVGIMKNVSNTTVERARVEIHLSNGTELGPTQPIALKPNMKKEIVLKATKKSFNGWSAHAEVGNLEHNGENSEGHNERERGEHGSKTNNNEHR